MPVAGRQQRSICKTPYLTRLSTKLTETVKFDMKAATEEGKFKSEDQARDFFSALASKIDGILEKAEKSSTDTDADQHEGA